MKTIKHNVEQINSLDDKEKDEFIKKYIKDRNDPGLMKRIINTLRIKWLYDNEEQYTDILITYNVRVKFLFAQDDQTIKKYDRNELKNLIENLELKTNNYIHIKEGNHDIIFNDVDTIYTFLTNQH